MKVTKRQLRRIIREALEVVQARVPPVVAAYEEEDREEEAERTEERREDQLEEQVGRSGAQAEQEVIAAVEAAMFTMEEAAEELEAQHAMTTNKYSGYEPTAPEVVRKLRDDAHQLETIVLTFLGRIG